MQFFPLTCETYPLWLSFWEKTPFRTADTTFINLFGWALVYGLEAAVEGDLFWIRRTRNGESAFWTPLGDTRSVNWESALAPFPAGTRFERIPTDLALQMQAGTQRIAGITDTPEQHEYLYERRALAEFSGRKLHKKRSHINAFDRLYGVDYRTLAVKDIPTITALSEAWLTAQTEPSAALQSEHEALVRMLSLWQIDSSVRCGGLFYKNHLIGCDFGSAVNPTMFVIHIEKGLPEYRGVYPTLVKYFADRSIDPSFTLINREQDLGDAGLRYSKTTYQPVDFVRKVALTLR